MTNTISCLGECECECEIRNGHTLAGSPPAGTSFTHPAAMPMTEMMALAMTPTAGPATKRKARFSFIFACVMMLWKLLLVDKCYDCYSKGERKRFPRCC
jgi:hypothetical protein